MKLIVTKWKQKEDSKLEADGLIRRNSNKPEYGSLMVTARVVIVKKGYMNTANRIGFITATVNELMDLIEDKGLYAGADFSELVSPHKIVVTEKVYSELTEDDKGFVEKKNPSTNQILSKDGEVIYRKTDVVEEGSDMVDRLLTHDTEPVVDEANEEFSKAKPEVIAEL
jgi:hypothetical protein